MESVIVFLSVCENEGLSIKDLVFACGLGESMVSRTVDALAQPDQGALLETVRHPTDGRRRLVYLTEAGQAVLAKLKTIIDNTQETA
nr:winged helix DNA-binding protein [Rhizomicrobium palustre]